MKIIEKELDFDNSIHENCKKALSLINKNSCIFDIETTGLSAKISSVYLIGATFLDPVSHKFILKQWFADDYDSEKNILDSFRLFLKDFQAVIHYNGDNFDIPFLNKKYKDNGLPSPFSHLESIDLLKKIRKKKAWFITENKKLVTMEKFIGYVRDDKSDGKECIELYNQYMQNKILGKEKFKQLENIILLHNNDDLIGSSLCCQYLFYTEYRTNQPTCSIININNKNMLEISDTIQGLFPKNFEVEMGDIFIRFEDDSVFFYIPIFQGQLKHYFKDYKNYIYLPDEDMAVHKDVGIYVDASHRENAKAKNCYIKLNSTFLPLPFNLKGEEKWKNQNLFFKEYNDKIGFIQFDINNTNICSTLSAEYLIDIINFYCN